MRIVHVSDVYLPALGGIELHVHDLAEQQRRRGHDVLVVTCTPGARGPADDPSAGPDGEDLPVLRVGRGGWTAIPPHVLAAIDTADVVHAHSSIVTPLAWLAARRAASRGVAAVVTMHSVVQRSPLVVHGLRAVSAVAGRNVVWAAVSGVAARSLQPSVPTPVQVLPNGIDLAAWPPAPVPQRPAGSPVTVVTVGRFAARKRVLPLVDVLADVRRRLGPDVSLRAVLAGDGPQREAVKLRLQSLGMTDWVELPGRLDRRDVHALYARSDVFVAPARLESFGLAALEARATGLPVVALAAAGVGEFVRDGVEGRLVADDRGLAQAVADLAADPVALAAMRLRNAATPPPLDWGTVVDRCLETYAYAVDVAGRRPVLRARRPQGMLSTS